MPACTPADNALREPRQHTLDRIAQDHLGIDNAGCAVTVVLDVQAPRTALENAFDAGRQTEHPSRRSVRRQDR